ncbi:MAG: lipid-A-disaccharide synthase, partial [Candidatus Latescibacterota bacterium]
FEVVRHLPMIRRTMRDLHALLDSWKPHLVILIDYPGFNLKFAPAVKARGIPLLYYISPQLWAWHESRVELIRKYVDRMVVLFGFEREFYLRHGIEADFVGHPLLDVVHPSEEKNAFRRALGAEHIPLIGFLPGSRKQEIRRILPAMVESLPLIESAMGKVRGALGCAPDLGDTVYHPCLKNSGLLPLRGKTYDIMAHSDVLVVTSGTATLEAGISGTPMVIVYRTSPLTYAIGKRLVKIRDIGLINIVAGSRIVPELRQNQATPEQIADQVTRFLRDTHLRNTTSQLLSSAREKLGESGASERAAAVAMNLLCS